MTSTTNKTSVCNTYRLFFVDLEVQENDNELEMTEEDLYPDITKSFCIKYCKTKNIVAKETDERKYLRKIFETMSERYVRTESKFVKKFVFTNDVIVHVIQDFRHLGSYLFLHVTIKNKDTYIEFERLFKALQEPLFEKISDGENIGQLFDQLIKFK